MTDKQLTENENKVDEYLNYKFIFDIVEELTGLNFISINKKMTDKQSTEYENKVDKYLNEKSVLELAEELMGLNFIKKVCREEYTEETNLHLQGKYPKIPLNNLNEIDSFCNKIYDKIEELSYSKKEARIFLDYYQKELKELPKLMNKLENISLEELNPKLEAVMEYIYDAVMNKGFEMETDFCRITKQDYQLGVEIGIEKKNSRNYTHLYLSQFKEKKKISFFKKEVNLIKKMAIRELVGKVYNSYYNDVGEVIHYITKKFLFKNEKNEILKNQIKTILSLPKIMNDYLKKRVSSLEDCFKDIKKDN